MLTAVRPEIRPVARMDRREIIVIGSPGFDPDQLSGARTAKTMRPTDI
jgi:hypothetical protein